MSVQEALLIVKAGSTLDTASEEFAGRLAVGTSERMEELDERIRKVARNWALERMAAVDRNLLRLASYEMLHGEDAPAGVVIDEALEIAKIYATAESARFINGILDKINKNGAKTAAPGRKRKAKVKDPA